MSPWYPKRTRYYQTFGPADEIEQGDIFWGVPTLTAAHPDLVGRFRPPFERLPAAEDLDPPILTRVVDGIRVFDDPVIVLPHTCDFYGPEKGRRNRARLIGRIQRLTEHLIGAPPETERLLRSGDGFNHTFFLPSWTTPSHTSDDCAVNFRFMTTVDAAYLSRARREARLSLPALIALRRRLAYFFTDYAPPAAELLLAHNTGGLIRDRLAQTAPPPTPPPEA